MSIMFRCKVCGGRHFGKCPIIVLFEAQAKVLVEVIRVLAREGQ